MDALRELSTKNNGRTNTRPHATSEQQSFGRVLVSPLGGGHLHQFDAGKQGGEEEEESELENQQQQRRKPISSSRQETFSDGQVDLLGNNRDKSTLAALRQQIDLAAATQAAESTGLANKQRFELDRSQQETARDDPFEQFGGTFHSPVEHVAMRKFKAARQKSAQEGERDEDEVVVLTTSNPREVFVVD